MIGGEMGGRAGGAGASRGSRPVWISGVWWCGCLLHLAAAGCVLNDLYREASERGIRVDGARVTASGSFDTHTWASTGITYQVELDSTASAEELAQLLDRVDQVAEIPRAIRAGATVRRG